MSAGVSPPKEMESFRTQTAASMATAASTAFPPFSKILAPAIAERGSPVTAIHFFPCSIGL